MQTGERRAFVRRGTRSLKMAVSGALLLSPGTDSDRWRESACAVREKRQPVDVADR
jgi:hypothetical protein